MTDMTLGMPAFPLNSFVSDLGSSSGSSMRAWIRLSFFLLSASAACNCSASSVVAFWASGAKTAFIASKSSFEWSSGFSEARPASNFARASSPKNPFSVSLCSALNLFSANWVTPMALKKTALILFQFILR
ncbi:hypothetical protein [Sphingobacterium sp.]|uniref:hypothetical protein n=1 Tax=Sphingobacterium sp. TaxID=341027 RepID=UPI0028B04A7F|nr:hypothetical protein [Sphingobacterium sp.]